MKIVKFRIAKFVIQIDLGQSVNVQFLLFRCPLQPVGLFLCNWHTILGVSGFNWVSLGCQATNNFC